MTDPLCNCGTFDDQHEPHCFIAGLERLKDELLPWQRDLIDGTEPRLLSSHELHARSRRHSKQAWSDARAIAHALAGQRVVILCANEIAAVETATRISALCGGTVPDCIEIRT